MSRRSAFRPEELRHLDGAVEVARDLTGQHFALPDGWFDAASHEICTVQDLRAVEVLEPGRYAQIRRLYRLREEGVLRCERLCPHYRICLQDHNILGRLDRDAALPLAEFLACVLVHEYVHLVRFCRLAHPYETVDDRRAEEEARVREITRRIVGRGHTALRRTAERLGL